MTDAADPYGLDRFVSAQDSGGAGGSTYERALRELRSGRKLSHWMWFVFPQIAGLGQSQMARTYAISSLAEARAYLEHPILGPRLEECARVLDELTGVTAEQVLRGIDSIKLRSSMTLFARAAPDGRLFQSVLERYFGGVPDEATEVQISRA